MSRQPLAKQDVYLQAFQRFEANGAGGDPSWARSLRNEAFSRFADLGFPTARRGNEEWKYTDVTPIANAGYAPLLAATPGQVSSGELRPISFGESRWHRLVFVDGKWSRKLSSATVPEGSATVINLAEGMATMPDLVEQHLAGLADYHDNGFTALNTAFLHDGALVHIPRGAELKYPVHLVFLTTVKAENASTHPRVLVVAGENSQATIVESYAGITSGSYFSNAVTEIATGQGASLQHYRVQRESDEAFHIHTTQVSLGKDSNYTSVVIDLGGRLTRNNLNVLMGNEGSSCTLNGLYIVSGRQHVDNQVIVDHASPYTTTRELYKGVLDDRSRAVFHGSIVVREGAEKVDARQEDRNLLLSDRAEADTKPAFWIYADDVKCSHGAACGKLDDKALFYLRSRGIDERSARQILTRGFVNEVVETIPNPGVQRRLEALVTTRLESLG